ncbi:MAG: xanthine dehydrogenase molybdopterin binding subunit [Myxococcales bacterium]
MSEPLRGSVGRAVPHEAAVLHVTGAAKYVDDLLPSALASRVAHAWPVLSTQAHARISALDASAARATPGVLCVLEASDVPGENDVSPIRRDEPLFPRVVEHHGQALCWVIAESESAARIAAGKVQVSYESLPALLSLEQAIEQQSFLSEPERMARGDATAALARARHRLQGELYIKGQEHFYLETQAALAYVDESDLVQVHSSTQHPTQTQEIVARVLGVPRNQVVVQCLRMGGAFGGKETQANGFAALAALAAFKLGRPVKLRLSRGNDMRMTGKRHPFLARFDVGFDDDGKLEGLDLALFSDGGYSLDLSAPIMARAMFHCDNCYLLPNVSIEGRACRTNYPSNTAFRGFGGPQGMVIIEDILDRVARQLRLPPHVVRERNFYREGDTTHYGQQVKDAERIERLWSELKRTSQFERRLEEIRAFNAQHAQRKRGIAITPVKFGISFTATFYNQAGALVLIYKDGTVQVNHGGTEMGQGLHTKIQQIAAHELGLPLRAVRVMPTRTDKVPNTSATAASSGSDLNGAAVQIACRSLRSELAEVASNQLGVHADDLEFDAGKVYPRGEEPRALPFSKLVELAYYERRPLFASGFYRTPEIHYDPKLGRGKPFHYYAYGAAVSEVEVDGFTGHYRLLRADLLHDVGSSTSPLVDRGQVEGGFLQGVGWLTTEEVVWSSQGALESAGASTYKLPSLGECPLEFHVHLLERAHESGVVHGSKAVGEPPFMLAISVREALRGAAAAFGVEQGPVSLSVPATPEAVYWALTSVRGRGRAAE